MHRTIAQRVFLFILGGFTMLVGGLFTWIMAQSFLNAKATRGWDEIPAQLLVAEVEERKIGEYVPTDYAAKVEYEYEYEGRTQSSQRLTPRGQMWAKERQKAELALGDFKPGTEVNCWVNPDDPTVAILEHDTKAAGYSIWFPLLFVIGGGGVMVGAFRRKRVAA